jgi:hypothetical protein
MSMPVLTRFGRGFIGEISVFEFAARRLWNTIPAESPVGACGRPKFYVKHYNFPPGSKAELEIEMDLSQQVELEAAAFRRLLAHLDEHKEVQNIDLMNLAGFCRNCLAKWYAEAAKERGFEMGYDTARERVYGMPYAEWKAQYQTEIK